VSRFTKPSQNGSPNPALAWAMTRDATHASQYQSSEGTCEERGQVAGEAGDGIEVEMGLPLF